MYVGDKLYLGDMNHYIMPPTLTYLYLTNIFHLSNGDERLKLLKEINKLVSSKKSNIDNGLGQFGVQNPFLYPINYEIIEPHLEKIMEEQEKREDLKATQETSASGI